MKINVRNCSGSKYFIRTYPGLIQQQLHHINLRLILIGDKYCSFLPVTRDPFLNIEFQFKYQTLKYNQLKIKSSGCLMLA